MSLAQKIAKLLTQKRKTLAAAESCTGGLLADTITNVPGSSLFFKLGVIAYDNKAKVKLLKISPSLIKKFGAVSSPIAKKMAQGARRILRSDFGIGVTGIAGPTGATKTKPVGLVFIAVSSRTQTVCHEFRFYGTRTGIKSQAATEALKLLLHFLK